MEVSPAQIVEEIDKKFEVNSSVGERVEVTWVIPVK
jgi:hypothetical protein